MKLSNEEKNIIKKAVECNTAVGINCYFRVVNEDSDESLDWVVVNIGETVKDFTNRVIKRIEFDKEEYEIDYCTLGITY